MRLASSPTSAAYSRPLALVKATCSQSPETVTEVASSVICLPPGSDTRRGARPGAEAMNASTFPFVSPATRFDAPDTNATHDPAWRKSPPTAAPDDGPLAGSPPRPRETRIASPPLHCVPLLLIDPRRL